jgi:hypothetical protein
LHVGLHNHPSANGENQKALDEMNQMIKTCLEIHLVFPQKPFLANLLNKITKSVPLPSGKKLANPHKKFDTSYFSGKSH